MIRKKEGSVGGDGREGDFDQMVVRSSGEQKRSERDHCAAKDAARDGLQQHGGDFDGGELLS
jgi:general stress protein YciG